MAVNEIPETNVTYEELIQLEYEFNDVEDEIGKSIQQDSKLRMNCEAPQVLPRILLRSEFATQFFKTPNFPTMIL
jgi:hypothetical protein